MKKIFIILSLIISSIYLVKAINLDLSSGEKLNNSSWQEINNITSKINLDNNNLNINGKLVSNSKICGGDDCLGECLNGGTWDTGTNSCNSSRECFSWVVYNTEALQLVHGQTNVPLNSRMLRINGTIVTTNSSVELDSSNEFQENGFIYKPGELKQNIRGSAPVRFDSYEICRKSA